MTGLLLSVRSAAEARVAVEAGAQIIDVKEPERGPLGPPGRCVVEEVVGVVGRKVAVSVALGELRDWSPATWGRIPRGVCFVKFGLAGCVRHSDWPQHWSWTLQELPAAVSPVAVVYADWISAAAPPPDQVLAEARKNRCRAVLFDTFDKSRGGLLDWFTVEELEPLTQEVRASRMLLVLAGSLSWTTIPRVLPLRPDYVAVRSAACRDGRSGSLDPGLAQRLTRLISGAIRLESPEIA